MGKGKKRTTIKDIASEAKVSPTTVSLVLTNEQTSRVGAATRKRILEIAKRLNYSPNYAARALVARESRTLGLVITTLINPFYSEIAQDIIGQAKELGYSVIIGSARDGLEDERRSVHDLLDRGVDGLIICSCLRHDPVISDLLKESIPLVLAVRNVQQSPENPAVNSVGVDNERGAYLAVEHLIKIGHKKIGFLMGDQQTSTGYDRYAGVLAAFDVYSMEFNPDLVLYGDFRRKSGLHLTRKLFSMEKDITAIVAHNDHMAIGVLDGLREKGIRVPEDIAVIGFDDIEMAGLPGIDLTTVTQKKDLIGRTAVNILIEEIKESSNHLAKRIILNPTLIIRESCGFHLRGSKYEL